MPTVDVLRDRLFDMLGQKYTDDEFQNLCFEFGIELDEVTSEKEMREKEVGASEETSGLSEDAIYKIDIPANRYDLLCIEGIASALRIFLQKDNRAEFKVVTPPPEKIITMKVRAETKAVRPYVVCAVLRDVTFDQARYESFIALQDKLHKNICRERTLVAIGTHDLDTVQAPFTYEALAPTKIQFQPLSETKEFDAKELFPYYRQKANCKLVPYLPIIESSPVYPVIYDSKRVVCSLPPIINGEHSKIKLSTKNVFIECTATDHTKANIVLNTVIAMFSRYCRDPFSVESVRVEYEGTGEVKTYPNMQPTKFVTDAKYINSRVGINETAESMAKLLTKMSLPARAPDAQLALPALAVTEAKEGKLEVLAPVTRSDILHPCDIMEDVAIAYGYNNIERRMPNTFAVAQQQPINKYTELLRGVLAQSGYMEVLTFALTSLDELFPGLRTKDDGKTAATLSNPRVKEFNVVRSQLLPGLLKTLGESNDYPKPIKLFEVSDVVLLDAKTETGARNNRRLCAVWCDTKSGLEGILSLLRRVMESNGVRWAGEGAPEGAEGYSLVESDNETFFKGRRVDVLLRGKKIGVVGIVHPEVLDNFKIKSPCSALEIDVQVFV